MTVGAQNEKTVEEFYTEVVREKESLGTQKDFITRSEFIAVLMKSMGHTRDLYVCSFYDIYDAGWEYVYIANAEKREIAKGSSDGAFFPDQALSVQDALTFISRSYKISPVFSQSINDSVISECDDYSKTYAKYALVNGFYPTASDGKYMMPKDTLSVDAALEMIKNYQEKQNFTKDYIDFASGYPKLLESGRNASIGVTLKVNKQCNVYYKILESDKTNSSYIPQRGQINNFLTAISAKDREINVNIPVPEQKNYNIYFVAVDDDGAISKVYTLMNSSPLPYFQGKGTKTDPYKIYSAYQLEQIRNYPDKCFVLCNDIEYNGEWTPIGADGEQNSMFSGVLDGGGYRISGLEISGADYVGLFARIYGGTVKNLNVFADVSGENYVGVIAGELIGGTIENCHTSGMCEAEENIAGGIVGKNDGLIKRCVSAVYAVTSLAYSGGVCGFNSGEVSECITAVSSVFADMYASSIAGINVGGEVSDCVGACGEATDTMTRYSGRITTNREQGTCRNNYVYDKMLSGEIVYRGKNGQDGEETSWDEITKMNFYEDKLSYSFDSVWTFGEQFLLPCINNVEEPVIQPGITIYVPLGISDETELINIKNNLNGHYYLENDITVCNELSWTPIGMTNSEVSFDNGFRGSLDGRGHTIKNLKMVHDEEVLQYGLFGMLYGGEVRNLNLENVEIEGHSYVGVIAGINYGTISNCSVSGKTQAYQIERETLSGGICAMNYGTIDSTISNTEIFINATSATAGGICAQNEGYIYGCRYDADITSATKKKRSNAFLGGISGINYSGMIYNCFAQSNIVSNAFADYVGGICGMSDGGELYMCSSIGDVTLFPEVYEQSASYIGGLVGLIRNGLVMNSFSKAGLSSDTQTGYMGGISGYVEAASIQNVYTINTLRQGSQTKGTSSDVNYAGGIAGFSDSGNISGAVAINPYIMTNGYCSDICPYSVGGYTDNNFYAAKMYKKGNAGENIIKGTGKELRELYNIEFYLKPVDRGGKLGWLSGIGTENIWKKSEKHSYPLPVLNDVDNQNVFYIDWKQ